MTWQQQLREMKYSDMEQKTPGAFIASGGRTMKLKPWNDTTANGLTNCIIDYINYSGIGHATRINTQGQVRKERVDYFGGFHKDLVRFTPSTTAKGTFDITATVTGRSVKVEVKIGKDIMSKAQLQQQEKEESAGALCFIARNMQSFVDWFKDNFKYQPLSLMANN